MPSSRNWKTRRSSSSSFSQRPMSASCPHAFLVPMSTSEDRSLDISCLSSWFQPHSAGPQALRSVSDLRWVMTSPHPIGATARRRARPEQSATVPDRRDPKFHENTEAAPPFPRQCGYLVRIGLVVPQPYPSQVGLTRTRSFASRPLGRFAFIGDENRPFSPRHQGKNSLLQLLSYLSYSLATPSYPVYTKDVTTR